MLNSFNSATQSVYKLFNQFLMVGKSTASQKGTYMKKRTSMHGSVAEKGNCDH